MEQPGRAQRKQQASFYYNLRQMKRQQRAALTLQCPLHQASSDSSSSHMDWHSGGGGATASSSVTGVAPPSPPLAGGGGGGLHWAAAAPGGAPPHLALPPAVSLQLAAGLPQGGGPDCGAAAAVAAVLLASCTGLAPQEAFELAALLAAQSSPPPQQQQAVARGGGAHVMPSSAPPTLGMSPARYPLAGGGRAHGSRLAAAAHHPLGSPVPPALPVPGAAAQLSLDIQLVQLQLHMHQAALQQQGGAPLAAASMPMQAPYHAGMAPVGGWPSPGARQTLASRPRWVHQMHGRDSTGPATQPILAPWLAWLGPAAFCPACLAPCMPACVGTAPRHVAGTQLPLRCSAGSHSPARPPARPPALPAGPSPLLPTRPSGCFEGEGSACLQHPACGGGLRHRPGGWRTPPGRGRPAG
jgi:hypothetical protein